MANKLAEAIIIQLHELVALVPNKVYDELYVEIDSFVDLAESVITEFCGYFDSTN